MALDTTILVNAMLANISNPTDQQRTDAQNFANAIKTFVEGAQIIYANGLTAPNGPVTGVFNCTIN